MVQITAYKVAYVILCAREAEARADPWDDQGNSRRGGPDAELAPEAPQGDAACQELRSFLECLNIDEQASLVALAWIGRGTYAAEELEEAIATAKAEHGADAISYLFSLPLLPDYLEDALEQLGYSVEDTEAYILRPV
jgi:Protein of unknown function (DUF3775)